jgi:exodeoxyribonuclease VII small subunit
LKQYEKAVRKMRQCYHLLEVAERKITVLAGFDVDGNPVTRPIEDESSGESADSGTLLKKQKSRGRRRGVTGMDPAASHSKDDDASSDDETSFGEEIQ